MVNLHEDNQTAFPSLTMFLAFFMKIQPEIYVYELHFKKLDFKKLHFFLQTRINHV